MLNRIVFTMINAIKYYAKIKKLKHISAETIANISLENLTKNNIKKIVLDFDGVLSAHGEDVPNNIAVDFLNKIYPIYNNNIFILSNKPKKIRKDYFDQHYPNINFIKADKKKPYPNGLNKIIKLTQAKPEELVLVDDRLLTGGLAAILANTNIIYISKPFVNYSKRPVLELFFQFLRTAERFVF